MKNRRHHECGARGDVVGISFCIGATAGCTDLSNVDGLLRNISKCKNMVQSGGRLLDGQRSEVMIHFADEWFADVTVRFGADQDHRSCQQYYPTDY